MLRPLILASLVLAAPAIAQETAQSAAAKFSREFKIADVNKDGVWTKDEVKARMARMRAGTAKPDPAQVDRITDLWFTQADANRNGKVTEKEAQTLLAAVFRRYDANGDGKVGGVKPGAKPAPRPQGR